MIKIKTEPVGRRYTLGKECYPFIITTGDIIKTFSMNGNERENGYRELVELTGDFAKGIRFYTVNRIINKLLENCRRKLEKPLKGFLREDKETGIYNIWDNSEPYIIKWFGEAALSIGKSVDWIKNGALLCIRQGNI
ncbi:MAG: hypothetical protein FJW63_00590 [Actinobacteria bacterium]|nr:hypothetical protein [Actinomycetota bacterium]